MAEDTTRNDNTDPKDQNDNTNPKDQNMQEDSSSLQKQDEKTVPYARFKEVNEKFHDVNSKLNALIEEKQKADGDIQSLLDNRTKERDLLLKKNLSIRIGQEFELPVDLLDRLVGTTEEELREDAERLSSLFSEDEEDKKTKPKVSGLPKVGDNRSPAPLDITTMSAAEIRKNRVKLQEQQTS